MTTENKKLRIKWHEDVLMKQLISYAVGLCISKLNWDSHETSWDFEANPLVALRNEKLS